MFNDGERTFDERFGGFDKPSRGFRIQRGMMEPAILSALAEKPMHGYEIITYLEEKSHGLWRPSAGSVYPTLQLLEEKDHVKSSEQNGKKIYELTEDGARVNDESVDQHKQMRASFADRVRGMKHMRRTMGDAVKLVRDIHHKGDAEQNIQLQVAIQNFKRELEQILEEES